MFHNVTAATDKRNDDAKKKNRKARHKKTAAVGRRRRFTNEDRPVMPKWLRDVRGFSCEREKFLAAKKFLKNGGVDAHPDARGSSRVMIRMDG